MQVPFFRPAALLLLAALVLYVIVRAIVPAMSRIDTDFPNYFTAARIVADGGEVDRLYDDAWFESQMQRYHTQSRAAGKFSPFPPPTALLLLPLASLEPLNALRALTGLSLLCLAGSALLLSRILAWSPLAAAVFVLLAGYAVINALRFGQPYILVSFSCVLGYYAYLRGRPVLAGLCFGLFTPIKYFPVALLSYFAWRRQWKLVAGAASSILAVVLLSILVLGWNIHRQFLSSVLGNHLLGHLSMQDPFTASFQSFDTLYRRLFIADPGANPRPWLDLPVLQPVCVALTKMALLLAACATLVKLKRADAAGAVAPSLGILGMLLLLLAPATATYHFVLLWLPVGLLINYFARAGRHLLAALLLGAYALIGFFPYRFTVPFEGRGALSALAYPRLWLLLAMFMGCLYGLWQVRPRTSP